VRLRAPQMGPLVMSAAATTDARITARLTRRATLPGVIIETFLSYPEANFARNYVMGGSLTARTAPTSMRCPVAAAAG
jgi:hypothetical protein